MDILLKWQKARLYQLLQEARFNPAEFEIYEYVAEDSEPGDYDYQEGDVLGLKGTDYYFGVYTSLNPDYDNAVELEFCPGKERGRESTWCLVWTCVEDEFADYLKRLRREIETVDPWSEVQTFFAAIELLPPEGPTKAQELTDVIPEPQRQSILKALKKVEGTLMKHVHDSKERQAFVRDQFKILEAASTKFNRKDYLLLAYNAVIGVATTVGLSSQFWAALLKPLMDALGFFVKLLR